MEIEVSLWKLFVMRKLGESGLHFRGFDNTETSQKFNLLFDAYRQGMCSKEINGMDERY
jgi:hypothetical protein